MLLKIVLIIASCLNRFSITLKKKPIKSLQHENLANQSIFNGLFMIEMININSFHESKNNFPLIRRKCSNRKNKDGEDDKF